MGKYDSSISLLANFNLVAGIALTVFVLVGVISVITYFVGLHGLWIPIMSFVLVGLCYLGRVITAGSIRTLENSGR